MSHVLRSCGIYNWGEVRSSFRDREARSVHGSAPGAESSSSPISKGWGPLVIKS